MMVSERLIAIFFAYGRNMERCTGYEGIYQVSNLGRCKSLDRVYFIKRNN